MGPLTPEVFNESCCDGGECNTKPESAQPCGCDPGANDYKCQRHRGVCAIPPPGWDCTRTPGHEGPCAAIPNQGGRINLEHMCVRTIQDQCQRTSVEHGFHQSPVNIDQKLLLIIGELIEAHNELREGRTSWEVYYKEGKPEGFPIEIADALIRLLQLSAALELDMQGWMEEKMNYNETRPYKHGKVF